MASLEIRSLTAGYGSRPVLRDLRAAPLPEGTLTALLGPNGSGKSTLLKTLAGLNPMLGGDLRLDGADFAGLSPARRAEHAMYMPQALPKGVHMTVLESVLVAARSGRARQGGDALMREAMQVLAELGINHLASRYLDELSGGQKQLASLAQALVRRPRLLLLDEPLSALDLKLRKRMQLELKHLQARLGIAFIFVTHDQEEAMTMADRVVVMHAGRIEQVGAGTDIYRQPATRFVAEFIGDANFIAYTVADDGALMLDAQGLRVPLAQRPAAGRGLAVLRPEDLKLCERADAMLTGTVSDVINVGSHSMIHVDIGGQTLVARHGGLAPGGLHAGGEVALAFAPDHLHLIGGQP